MNVIVVNRWRCEHLPHAEIIATAQRGSHSRLALSVGWVTHLEPALHLPDADETRAHLICLGYLCASGKACSEKKPWVLEYLFPTFKQAKDEQAEEEAIALGFPNAKAAQEHSDWLAENSTPEYKAWLASIPKNSL